MRARCACARAYEKDTYISDDCIGQSLIVMDSQAVSAQSETVRESQKVSGTDNSGSQSNPFDVYIHEELRAWPKRCKQEAA